MLGQAPTYPLLAQAAGIHPLSAVVVEIRPGSPTLRQGLTSVLVSPGVVDANAREFFGYGGCCLLTGAMHELSGWPILVAEQDDGSTTVWKHMGVATPDGKFLDINGPRPLREVLAEYNAARICTTTLDRTVSVGAINEKGWRHHSSAVVNETILYFADHLISSTY